MTPGVALTVLFITISGISGTPVDTAVDPALGLEGDAPLGNLAPRATWRDLGFDLTPDTPGPQAVPTRTRSGFVFSALASPGPRAVAVSLAASDLDDDGVLDLIVGHAGPDGGFLEIHRGNIDSIFPHRPARSVDPAAALPFHPPRRVLLPARPEFLATGDFDNDGRQDVALAEAGRAILHILRGNGDGRLATADARALAGPVTAMGSGEIDRADGLVDLAVAVGETRPAVLIFAHPEGALAARAEVISLPEAVRSITLGRFDDDFGRDLSLVTGERQWILRGRERRPAASRPRSSALEPRPAGSELAPRSSGDALWHRNPTTRPATVDEGTIRLLTDPPEPDETAARVLPMRLNPDAVSDFVVLINGQVAVALSEAAATITVTSSADSAVAADGQCTLREAIANANADADTTGGDCAAGSGADQISFGVGAGQITISPLTALPPVSDAVTIDGDTQGCGSPPCVALSGSASTGIDGLVLSGGSSTLRGLAIGGFDNSGISVSSDGNILEGNHLGTDFAGTAALANGIGLSIVAGSNNIVGGAVPGAGNLISGNDTFGLLLGPGSTGTQVLGNIIGLDDTAGAGLPNLLRGVEIPGSDANTIGGTTAGARNIISGNIEQGVLVSDDATANVILGNYIGTDGLGLVALGNGVIDVPGVQINDSSGNTVGGTAVGARNLLSGNFGNGVFILAENGQAEDNEILGNFIGTAFNGKAPLPNEFSGVVIVGGQNNIVGGTTPSARNICSGNLTVGVLLSGAGTSGNRILGNRVGTDSNGDEPLPNAESGVQLQAGVSSNSVGGTEPGAGNLISSNGQHGVEVRSGSNSNEIQGNLIGVDLTGLVPSPNQSQGVEIDDANDTLVGGDVIGARNVISGNNGSGIALWATGTVLQGNFIGVDITGSLQVPNLSSGVLIRDDANGNTVGGIGPTAGNVISGNSGAGLRIIGDDNQVLGNLIGVDATGLSPVGNTTTGIHIYGLNNTIGGTAPGAGNVISGNSSRGLILVSGSLLQGNLIGVDASGLKAVPNGGDGVRCDGQNIMIGGTTPGAANVISGNGGAGVSVNGNSNVIQGNLIGTDVSGENLIGNAGDGIVWLNINDDNLIGGTTPAEGNIIAGNTLAGVNLGPGGRGNGILGNSIFDNGELGIDLDDDGVTPNDPGDGDTGGNDLQNFPVLGTASGTPSGVTITGTLSTAPGATYRVEFFGGAACDGSGHGEGERILGSTDVVTDGTGNVSFSPTVARTAADGEVITATATDFENNTSEFSACITASCGTIGPFPLTLLASDPDTLFWASLSDVHYVKGDLSMVDTYATTGGGTELWADTLDISADDPPAGEGVYYLVKPYGCGSWQTSPGAEPGRDASLP